jgi:hypothetical protein
MYRSVRTEYLPPYLRTFHLKDSNLGGVEGCGRAGAGLSKWKLEIYPTAAALLQDSIIYLITFIIRIYLTPSFNFTGSHQQMAIRTTNKYKQVLNLLAYVLEIIGIDNLNSRCSGCQNPPLLI